VGRGRRNGRPVFRGEYLPCPRHDLLFLDRQMVAVVEEIRRRRRLDGGALDQGVLGDRLEQSEKRLAGGGDDAVLLEAPGDRKSHLRIALDEARERDIFPGMVDAVRVVMEVVHDVEEQRVIGVLAGVERCEFPLDEVEQVRESRVIGVPDRDGFSHGLTVARAERAALTRVNFARQRGVRSAWRVKRAAANTSVATPWCAVPRPTGTAASSVATPSTNCATSRPSSR